MGLMKKLKHAFTKVVVPIASAVPGPWQVPALAYSTARGLKHGDMLGAAVSAAGAYGAGGGFSDKGFSPGSWTEDASNYLRGGNLASQAAAPVTDATISAVDSAGAIADKAGAGGNSWMSALKGASPMTKVGLTLGAAGLGSALAGGGGVYSGAPASQYTPTPQAPIVPRAPPQPQANTVPSDWLTNLQSKPTVGAPTAPQITPIGKPQGFNPSAPLQPMSSGIKNQQLTAQALRGY